MTALPYARPRCPNGYSLLEVLFVLGLMATLLGLAVNYWQGLRQRWAVRDIANQYQSALHWARSHALQTGQVTTVCPSNDGKYCTQTGLESGWIIYQGDDTQPNVVQDGPPIGVSGITTHYGHRTLPMGFAPNGMVEGLGLRQINLCVTAHPSASLGVVINQTGRARWEEAQGCP